MAKEDLVFPRLVYRGAADDTAETLTVSDQSALDQAVKEGYRLTRVDKKHQAPEPTGTIDLPAQKVTVDPAKVAAHEAGKLAHDSSKKK